MRMNSIVGCGGSGLYSLGWSLGYWHRTVSLEVEAVCCSWSDDKQDCLWSSPLLCWCQHHFWVVLSSKRMFEGVERSQEQSWNVASAIEGLFKGFGKRVREGSVLESWISTAVSKCVCSADTSLNSGGVHWARQKRGVTGVLECREMAQCKWMVERLLVTVQEHVLNAEVHHGEIIELDQERSDLWLHLGSPGK